MSSLRNLVTRLSVEGGNKATAELDKFGKTGDRALRDIDQAAGAANRQLLQLMGGTKALGGALKVAGAAAVGLAGAQGIGGAVGVIGNFEAKLSEIRAVMRPTAEDMTLLTEVTRELGATSIFSASQAAEAAAEYARAGFNAAQTATALPGSLDLAAAGALGLKEAVGITTGVLKAYQLEASESSRVSDVLAASASSSRSTVQGMGQAFSFVAGVADNLQVSMETTGAALAVLADRSIDATRGGTGLRRVLGSLVNPTGPQVDGIKNLNLSLQSVNPVTNDFITVLRRLNEAGFDATAAFQIFGKEGADIALALVDGVDRVAELTTKFEAADGAARQMADTMSDNLQGDVKALRSAIEELTLQSGDSGLLGAMRDVVQVSTEVARSMGGMGDAAGETDERIKALATTIEVAGTVLLTAFVARKFGPAILGIGIAATTAARGMAGLTAATKATSIAKARASLVYGKGAKHLLTVGSSAKAARLSTIALGRSMALLGGPFGVLLTGATLAYQYREEIGDAARATYDWAKEVTGFRTVIETDFTTVMTIVKETGFTFDNLGVQLEKLDGQLSQTLGKSKEAIDVYNSAKNIAGAVSNQFVPALVGLTGGGNDAAEKAAAPDTRPPSPNPNLNRDLAKNSKGKTPAQKAQEAIAGLRLEAKNQELLNAAILQGADAYDAAKVSIEAETKIRQLGIVATSKQADAIRLLTADQADLVASGKRLQEQQENLASDGAFLDGLRLQQEQLGLTERQLFVYESTARLSADATEKMRLETIFLSGELYDEQQAIRENADALREAEQAADNFQRSMVSAFQNGIQNAESFGDVLEGIARQLVATAAADPQGFLQFAGGIARDIAPSVFSGGSSSGIGLYNAPTTGAGFAATPIYADGGVNWRGQDIPLRRGGTGSIANGAGMYVAGEAGPEAIIPLSEGRFVDVRLKGHNGNTANAPVIKITTINNSSGQIQQSATARQNADGSYEIRQVVEDVVVRDYARNGPIAQASRTANQLGVA